MFDKPVNSFFVIKMCKLISFPKYKTVNPKDFYEFILPIDASFMEILFSFIFFSVSRSVSWSEENLYWSFTPS